jgi:hypothetical protein
MATPRGREDPKAMLSKQEDFLATPKTTTKNRLFQAYEAMAKPRALKDPNGTSRKQEDPMATPRTPTTKK